MPQKSPKSVGDTTDPKGTRRPDEPPTRNKKQPLYHPLIIKEHAGGPRLPQDLISGDINALISLFLTPQLLQAISEATNAYAQLGATKQLRSFLPVTAQELRTWLGIHIYMTTTPGVRQQDYWRLDPLRGSVHPLIPPAMSRNRWQAIAGALHLTDPRLQVATVFGYVSAPGVYLA